MVQLALQAPTNSPISEVATKFAEVEITKATIVKANSISTNKTTISKLILRNISHPLLKTFSLQTALVKLITAYPASSPNGFNFAIKCLQLPTMVYNRA